MAEFNFHVVVQHGRDSAGRLLPETIALIGGLAGVGWAPDTIVPAGITLVHIHFSKATPQQAIAHATRFVRLNGG